MSGSYEAGKKAAETNKKRYGKDFYRRIGELGGQSSHTGGFYGNSEKAREAGRKGHQSRKEKANEKMEASKSQGV